MSEELRSIPPQHGSFVFTSESVTEGHPDKIADQISDAVLDAILAKEIELQEQGYIAPNGVPANVENVRCACETLVTTGTVIVAGEIRTQPMSTYRKSPAALSAALAITVPSSVLTATPAAYEPHPRAVARYRPGRRRVLRDPDRRHHRPDRLIAPATRA